MARLVSRSIRRRVVAAVAAGLALAAIAVPARATDGTWSVAYTCTAPFIECPSERSTPAVGPISDDFYLFGGVRDDFRTGIDVFFNDLYKFDPSALPTPTWTRLLPAGPVPAPRAFAAGLGDPTDDKLYVFGGAHYQANFVGFVAHGDLWAYDVSDNAWSLLSTALEGPGGRSRPSMWIDGDTLYLFGGIDSLFRTYNDLWKFDLSDNHEGWTKLVANDPGSTTRPTRHEAQNGTVPIGGKLIIYGGEHVDLPAALMGGEFFTLLDDTWSYDLASGTWSDLTPAGRDPQDPRNYGAAAIIGGKIYLHGGDIPGGSQDCGAPFPQNTNNEIWRFEPGASPPTWTELLSVTGVPEKLKRHVAAVVDGSMYLFAGYDFDCSTPTSPGQVWITKVYKFTPAS